jgi:CRISPR-associated exonuclease Cas4
MAAWFFVLLALALLLLWWARRARIRSGLPPGQVIYTDTGGWRRLEHPLFSSELRLTGKPDYLVDDGDAVVPVEVKSGGTPDQPYRSHVLQLAAYCLLVETEYHQRPPYGIIKYPQQTFQVAYTSALEDALLDTLDAMQADLDAGDAPRDHDDPARCRACGYRDQCEQSVR